MSPLRRWMSEHGHPSWWSWLVVIGGCLTTLVIAIVISVEANQRAIEREREARLESERSLCGVLAAFDDSYREVPHTTATGIKVAKRIAAERSRRCPPVIEEN